jgi:DNA primase catalytic core
MRVNKEEIEAIKRDHDLREVIESYGVKLKKKGGGYVGLCPFHKEKTPSFTVNPKTNLYHCFGCNAGGDVIGFVCKKEGIGFREAYAKLSRQNTAGSRQGKAENNGNGNQTPQSEIRIPQSVNRARLLNRVVSFHHKTFCEDQRAAEYLRSRGITDNSIFADFKIGFSNGTLLNTIPDDGDVRDALKEIGILNSKGHEMFYGCVVFPIFDENKDCVGLYGRRLVLSESEGTQNINSPNHLYLPGPRKGVFNYQAAKRSKALILTESIIDALTLYSAGFKDVIPCYGVNGLTEDHLTLFARCQTKEVYLCFDRDDAGNQGAERIAGRLRDKGIDPYIVNLPSLESGEKTDINSFFSFDSAQDRLSTADAPLIFERLLKEANSRASIRSDKVIKQEQKHYEKTDVGFIVQYGERRYEVRGITREGVKLKATIKAIKQPSEARGQRFHLDTVDLNSNRSRLFFGKACAVLFGEKEELILEDMTKLIDLAESWRPEEKEGGSFPKMTQSDEEEALEFLKTPSLFNRILEDFETIGFTGEEANKLMGYLAATSRKLDEPLSILIQSRSAAGKSALQDAIMMLIPPEDHARYTRLTGQALFYKEENSLAHKLLAIEEEHGAREASYSIRNIQSSKYLSIAATGKDPLTGKLRTEEYRVKGPVALMITTTEVELDYETSNRFITLSIDESREMTERILKKQREQETLEGLIKKAETERIIRRHHNAQRLLRPLQVINPYASYLTYPSESLRARRDHKKYLGLIKAIAFLHQYQREIKSIGHANDMIQFIEVIFDDIEKANRLANEVLGRCLDELSPPSRLLLKMIREMVETRCKELKIEPKDYRFTRRDIREWSKWSDFQIKCHIRQLEDLEYIYSVAGKKGKEYIYELLYPGGGEDGKPFLMGLTTIEQLKEKLVLAERRNSEILLPSQDKLRVIHN